MDKYLEGVFEFWQYKIFAGVITSVFTPSFFQLLLIFAILEVLDILTRWTALSYQCHKAIYPQSPCGIGTAILFWNQARKWRYIRSTGLREGVDKILLYLLVLLTGAIVDAAFSIGHAPQILSSITVVVLASTEGMSILENLSECNATVLTIKKQFLKRAGDKNDDG